LTIHVARAVGLALVQQGSVMRAGMDFLFTVHGLRTKQAIALSLFLSEIQWLAQP
jgi:hypothetical protein